MSSCIDRILIIGRTLVVTTFVSSTLSVAIPRAQAAELQVEVTISIRDPVAEMATAFENRTGQFRFTSRRSTWMADGGLTDPAYVRSAQGGDPAR